MTGKAKKVATGKNAKVKVKVTAPNEDPTGKVRAKIGTKQVAKGTIDASGKVTLTIKARKLKVGKNKVKLSYVGDDFTAPGKTKVIVRVTK